ncbi:MAG: hypothetical protein J2P39_14840, partial [Candidatus Dormibacteraeota bacterium]|nr:hypothetical protein [Candidatus Dormibacteraeota bacterium]
VLLLAGTDFAEWSEVVGGRLSSAAQRLGSHATTIAIAAGALAILGFDFWSLGDARSLELESLAYALLPAAAVAIVVGLLVVVASRRRAGVRVPLWALVLGMLLVYLPAMSLSFVPLPGAGDPSSPSGSGGLASYAHRGDPSFSLHYPARWQPVQSRSGLVLEGRDPRGMPVRFMVVHTAAGGSGMGGAVAREGPLSIGVPITTSAAAPRNGWQRGSVRATLAGVPLRGPVWSRVEGKVRWTLAGLAPATGSTSYGGTFARIWSSWSPSVPGPARHFDTSRGVIEFGIAGVLLVAGGLLLMTLFRGPGVAGGAFLTLSGFSFFLQIGLLEAQALFGIADRVSAVAFDQALGLLPPLLLVLVLTSRIRNRAQPPLRPLLTLVAGLCALTLLYSFVFPAALESKRFSVLQGCVLLLAMLWDVMMSGESITNRGGWAVPRHSRALIYLGYIVMVVAAVMFFSSMHGPSVGDAFESELWVQNGIDFLGLPLLLTFFVVNLAAAWLGPSARPEPVANPARALVSPSMRQEELPSPK